MTKFYKFYLIDIGKSSTIYHAYPMESLSAIVCVNKEMIKLKMQHYNQLIPVLLIKISKNSIASIPIIKCNESIIKGRRTLCLTRICSWSFSIICICIMQILLINIWIDVYFLNTYIWILFLIPFWCHSWWLIKCR